MEISEDQNEVENDVDYEETDEVYVEPAEFDDLEDDWQPNYTFKVMDQEREFDDFIKPVLTKDNYDQVKDLYEKAYGIDHVKTKNNTLKEENTRLSGIEQKYNGQNQSLGHLGSLIQSKDWHSFFSELKIPEQEVLKYALDRVNYQDLSPSEKQEYDGNIESRQKLRNLETQNLQLQQTFQQQQLQARSSELDNYLNADQYRDIVNHFDSRAGQPGAFRDEVIRRGQMSYYTYGKDVPTQQVVEEVVKLYGNHVQTQTSPGTENTQGFQPQQQNVASNTKPVIPNLRSGSGSPARKLPNSIDDIRKAIAAYN